MNSIKSALRPLPVILLLDVSGSMSGTKISSLNHAVREMLKSFSKVESTSMNINVAIITFGNAVKVHTPLTQATEIDFKDVRAYGHTPLGEALTLCKKVIEDMPNNTRQPIILLVSDGAPNGNWEGPFEDFISNGLPSKCDRHSIAIGVDADYDLLQRFLDSDEKTVLEAVDADGIEDLFRQFTQATVSFAEGKSPSFIEALNDAVEEDDDDDYDY